MVETMDLSRIPAADLRRELARGLTLVAEQLYRLGLVWVELEQRGEDLSDLRAGLNWTLPLIGSGLLAAEAVIAFAGRRSILREFEGMPLDQQRRLAAGEPVAVVTPDGPHETELVPVRAIPAARLRTVFAEGKVLPPGEQRLRLAATRPRRKPSEGAGYRYRPRYDREAGTVAVGKMTIPLADLLSELAAAAGPDHPPTDVPGEFVAPKTRLTQEESRRLLAVSRAAGLPEWEMIRKALRAFGLI